MPRHRPMEGLRQLGRRIKARRLHRGMTQVDLARAVRLSVAGVARYEAGEGHPPALRLHQIAAALNTTVSSLLGEYRSRGRRDEDSQIFDDLAKLYAHPTIGTVTRYMQDMTKEDRLTLQVLAAALAKRNNGAQA